MRLLKIEHDEEIRFRKFWPVDRESPIFEIVVNDDVLFDVAREGAAFSVTFHAAVPNVMIASDVLMAAILSATSMIIDAEHDDA
jgi:hypothetical protein